MKLNRRAFAELIGAVGIAAAIPARAQAKNVEVTIKHDPRMGFSPATVTVKAGDTIQWTNPYSVTHTVTFDPAQAQAASNVVLPAGVTPFGSEDLSADDTYSHTFDKKGTYQYVCKYHEAMGMIGKVVVT